MEDNFVGKRVTELRLKKGVSEYKISVDMGHSSSYINTIVSGKALPSMGEFFYLCDYLGVTPRDFFDSDLKDPQPLRELYEESKKLSPEDLKMITGFVKRLSQLNQFNQET